MWILLWIAISSTGEVDHYHLATYNNKNECDQALIQSKVLITQKGQSVICVDTTKGN